MADSGGNRRRRTIADEQLVYAELGQVCADRNAAAELARRTHVSKALISRIRHGDARMTPRVAEALGFRLRYERIRSDG